MPSFRRSTRTLRIPSEVERPGLIAQATAGSPGWSGARMASRRRCCGWSLEWYPWTLLDEVVAPFDVLDEAGVGGLPAHEFLRDGARGGHVGAEQAHQQTPVLRCRQRPGRQVQVPADYLGNLADGHAFVTDGVEH